MSHPTCPIHRDHMFPRIFEPWEVGNGLVGFSCANLKCPIIYLNEGVPEGFYALDRGGKLIPYLKAGHTH